MSTFQSYLLSINTEYNDDCYWGQHYDTETRTIINIKSIPKTNQKLKTRYLETNKEKTYPEDIETGVYKNLYKNISNKYTQYKQTQINYHNIFVMTTIYISHILLVILLFKI